MADTMTAAERAAADIMAKLEATTAGLSEAQRAEVEATAKRQIDEYGTELLAKLESRTYKPEPAPGNELDGTRYGRMGMSALDVQMAHGILAHGREIGWSKRGPSEEMTNIVRAITNRVVADERLNMRSMDTGDTTALIGAQYISEMWTEAMQGAVVAPLIRSFAMTDALAHIPVFGAPPTPVIYGQSTQDDSSDYETQDTAFARVSPGAPPKFGIHQKWSGELEEESIVPFITAIRKQQTDSMAYFTDDIIVNGDTTLAATGNINSDDAQLASNNRYVGFDGIRHAALVDNTNNVTNASTLTYAQLIGLRGLCLDRTRLHNWGYPANPADFVYLVNPEGMETIANLDELITVDKFGTGATVLNGQVARIGMNPLFATMAVPTTEADGKVSATPGNNTFDQVVAFNRNAYSIGYLRQMTVETYREAKRDQSGIVLFWRMTLARYSPTGAASGIEHTAVIRNF